MEGMKMYVSNKNTRVNGFIQSITDLIRKTPMITCNFNQIANNLIHTPVTGLTRDAGADIVAGALHFLHCKCKTEMNSLQMKL